MSSARGRRTNENSEPVQVIVRIRPEPGFGMEPAVVVARGNRSVALLPMPHPPLDPMAKSKPSTETKTFTFDRVFHPQATQPEVYEVARPLVTSAVDGYNSTIFAYGHTGSGKTYTMMGTPEKPGLTPRAVREMFGLIQQMSARERDTIFIVRMSYVELYNNQFRNLLDMGPRGEDGAHGFGDGASALGFGRSAGSSRGGVFGREDRGEASLRSSWRSMAGTSGSCSDGRATVRSCEGSLASLVDKPVNNRTLSALRSGKIEVRESPKAGVFLSGPGLRHAVTSAAEALRMVSLGDAARATGATDCNEHSSRSHAILSFHVESQRVSTPVSGGGVSTGDREARGALPGKSGGGVRLGKLHLIDLAGSERLSLSGAEGQRLNETQNINLSLSSLGNVLACLSRNATIAARRGSSRGTSQGGVGGPARTGETPAPVPYRDSKLTHFLKDSLGGNSKTLMVTTLRSTVEYHRQSLVSLMYASRAKKVRNQSCVNVDTAGQSNIHQVSAEIETLRDRLQQRSVELGRLNAVHESGRAENAALRDKLQGLSAANERERAQLEEKLSKMIHSQAGKLAVQHQAFVTLQSRLQQQLGEYQQRCMKQQEEISHLRSTIESLERDGGERVGDAEVAEMQSAMAMWQAQATGAQEEARLARQELERTRVERQGREGQVDRLAAELKAAESRERALLGYWRQLQGALELGTAAPMRAEAVIGAVHRLRQEKNAEVSARAEAERARVGVEKAARALSGGAGDCRNLERRLEEQTREMERKRTRLVELEAENVKASEMMQRLSARRAETEAAIALEEAEQKAAAERLSKVEQSLGRVMEMQHLRAAVDASSADLEAARTEAAKYRRDMQEAVSSRDEAMRSGEAMRARLSEFEGTLRGVSEETLVVLEKKEAIVRRVQAERERDRQAWEADAQRMHQSLENAEIEAARLDRELAETKAELSSERESAAASATAAAGAAVAESGANARAAVAIGERQDAEKTLSATRDQLAAVEWKLAGSLQELDAARESSASLKEQLEQSRAAEIRARSEGSAASAAAGAGNAAASRAAAELAEARVREEEARSRLREMEETVARERDSSARRLRDVEGSRITLEARVHAAEKKLQEEVNRGQTKVEAVIQQKDEMVKSLLRKRDAEHESALAAERRRAQHAIKNAVEATDRERRREAAAAISAIRREKDEAERQALAAKDAELRDRLEKASAAARAAIESAESRARSAGTKAEALARDATEKVRSVQQESANALGVAQEELARLERKHEEEIRRLQISAEALATERDKLAGDRDTAIAEVSRQRGLLDEERRARELAMREAQDLFTRQQEDTEERFREAAAREKQEALEAEKGERQRLVDEAVRRKDREMAKALKAAGRLAASTRRDAQVAAEAEKRRAIEELEQKLEVGREAHRSEVAALRAEAELRARDAKEAAARTEKEQRDALEEAARVADRKVFALEAEVARVNGELERVPEELGAQHERTLAEKEREVRELVRGQADTEVARLQSEWAEERQLLEDSLRQELHEARESHETTLREAIEATAAEKDVLLAEAREKVLRLEERCREAERDAGAAQRGREAAHEEATAQSLAAVERSRVAEAEAEARHCREMEQAKNAIAMEKSAAMEEAVAALERRHREAEREALEAFAREKEEALTEAISRGERNKQEAVEKAVERAVETARLEQRDRTEQWVRKECEDEAGRVAQRHAEDLTDAVRSAVGAATAELERQHAEELEAMNLAGEAAVREAANAAGKEVDETIMELRQQANGERQKRRKVETALKRGMKELKSEKIAALERQQRAHREAMDTALASLASEKDQAMRAAVEAEGRRATAEAEARIATLEARVSQAETSATLSKQEALAAAEEGERAAQHQAEEAQRRLADETKATRQAREEVERVKEETEATLARERSGASRELEQLREHSSELAKTLRQTQTALSTETQRAHDSAAEAHSLLGEVQRLESAKSQLSQDLAKRDEEIVKIRETEIAALQAAKAESAARLAAAVREAREFAEGAAEKRLFRALEGREQEHMAILGAALERSEAALRELARIKEAMWEKAEDNAEALQQAFEAAAARAAEEAEVVTAEALARADKEYQGKIAELTRALAETDKDSASGSRPSSRGGAERMGSRGEEALPDRGNREMVTRAAMDEALAAQKAEHERVLNAELAAQDAERLEALQCLDEEYRHLDDSKESRTPSTPRSSSKSAEEAAENSAMPPEVTTPEVGRRRRGGRRRSLRSSSSSSLLLSVVGTPSETARRLRAAAFDAVTPKTAAALEHASAGRDRTSRDARDESDGVGGAASSGWSEPPISPQDANARVPPPSLDVVRSEISPYDRAAAGSTVAGSSTGSCLESPATDQSGHLGATSPAPIWTVISPLRDDADSTDDDDAEAAGSDRREIRAVTLGGDPLEGEAGNAELASERLASCVAATRSSAGDTMGFSNEDSTTDLTETERWYRRELEGMHARVQELEGLVERRLENEERVQRRKSRAAIAERRTQKDREQDSQGAHEFSVGARARNHPAVPGRRET